MNNHEVVPILLDLIETCRRGRNVFRSAADSIQNSEFRRLFNIFAQQRMQFITELQAETNRLGHPVELEDETAAPRTTTLGANPDPAAFRDEPSVVSECEVEEEAAVNDYQDALKMNLPLDVQYVVKRQYMDIKDAYDRMRILQRAA
jgi:uncharacterized protein (TIGR02284 family)